MAGRYIELHVRGAKKRFVLNAATVKPVLLPVRRRPVPGGLNPVQKKIWETAVRTLELCMHEHYEDCPWREQALYAMDSRNQMLFGYAVFRDGGCYAQANLRLISHGLRSDGLLELCFPARVGVTIPSFSLYFVLAVAENYAQTGDATEIGKVAEAKEKEIMEI